MKALITTILILFFVTKNLSQELNIQTHSISLDDFISFIVSNYKAHDSEDRNITFLIQQRNDNMNGESLIMLKQGFKLISERLSENSKLSILTFYKYNGVALKITSAKEKKLILHTLTDLKGNIAEFYEDGIALAYSHSEQHYAEDYLNEVVIIRMNSKSENEIVNLEKEEKNEKNKKKGKVLLAAALAILPELIDVIKN